MFPGDGRVFGVAQIVEQLGRAGSKRVHLRIVDDLAERLAVVSDHLLRRRLVSRQVGHLLGEQGVRAGRAVVFQLGHGLELLARVVVPPLPTLVGVVIVRGEQRPVSQKDQARR
ncbi:hypothetical protein CJ014_24575 [Pleomorphomonas carboxyditropha]|uniref:Uncharacterized protein n=1 Tax=Pleomorphomonas carboxyditropha TaxID=2023338 RepID=A0A2G9WPJ8_9HYPH|nr:hypothetical protein CJ014_24575 [Pleomorphomonas carboxyditropha]